MIFWRKKKNVAEQDTQELKQPQESQELVQPSAIPEPQESKDFQEPLEQDVSADEAPLDQSANLPANLDDDIDQNIWSEPADDTNDRIDESANKDTNIDANENINDGREDGSWLSRLTSGLTKSSSKFTQGLTDILTKKKLDQDMLDNLEELLISADLGPKTAMKIVEEFSQDRFGKDVTEEDIRLALAESMENILTPVAQPLQITKPENGPFVILVCGVNGAGKTTTIGKMAHDFTMRQKKSVMLVAGDTFRAAAIEQLRVWAQRVGCPLVAKDIGADAAAVAYEAYEKAQAEGRDILMIDTAGRLQNKQNLMAELEKIIRVLKKRDPDIPHAVLLVLDATTGQNAFSQVEIFREIVHVTGLIVTKLDGTAKGGVLVGLADQFGLPVHAIGVGEKIEDLAPFRAQDFANSLVGAAGL